MTSKLHFRMHNKYTSKNLPQSGRSDWHLGAFVLVLAVNICLGLLSTAALALPRQCSEIFSPKNSEKASQAAREKIWRQRSQSIERNALTVSDGQSFDYEFIAPEFPDRPVLLFLPGSNRGLTLDLGALQLLGAEGFGLASMNFSTQPPSIARLSSGVSPKFMSTRFRLQDLAAEVEFYAEKLRGRGYKNIVPVALSYSGAVSPFLKSFPFVIETSPMTTTAAAKPELKTFMDLLEFGRLWNPVFGPSINRALLDQAYTKTWTQQVDAIVGALHLPTERKSQMIAGYLAMSRAAEGFSWKKEKVAASKVQREFIFAGRESPSLMLDQLETFRMFATTHSGGAKLTVIGGAGHLIVQDQPTLFTEALKKATLDFEALTSRTDQLTSTEQIEISFYEPAAQKSPATVSTLKNQEALSWLDQMINELRGK